MDIDETLRRTPLAVNMHDPAVIEPEAVREEEVCRIIGADETYSTCRWEVHRKRKGQMRSQRE